VAHREDAEFNFAYAVEAPFGIDDGLDEGRLLGADRRVVSGERGEAGFVKGEVVGGEQDGDLSALRDDVARPASDVGPVESWALARLALT
jgi:hypothetical protein